MLCRSQLVVRVLTAYTAGSRWDKLKSLNCHFLCNKAVIFILCTTVVVALDALVILTFTNVISHYFALVTLPAIVVNYLCLVYLLDKAKSLRAARAAANRAGDG